MTDGAVPSGLPTLDHDVLKLLFRDILAQKAVRNSAGTLIAKLSTINKVCLDAIGHVTNRFRKATLTSRGMTLHEWDCREPAIVITATQFVWLVQWGMLHLKRLKIASRNAREWQPFVEYFEIPSLETLRYAVPLHKARKHTDNSSVDLAADIVKLNASSIKQLDGMPVWRLSEPLPALHLKQFTYVPRSWGNNLNNLAGCVVDELVVFLERGDANPLSLDVLAGVNVTKIVFHTGLTYLGFVPVAEGTTNEHVRRIHFKLDRTLVDANDIDGLHRFLPNLTCVQIDADVYSCNRERGVPRLWRLQEIGKLLSSDPSMPSLKGRVQMVFTTHWWETRKWTAENVLDEYGRIQEARDAIAEVPPQLRVWASVDATFHRAGKAETKEAHELASKLGFTSESFDGVPRGLRVAYNQKVELGPTRQLHVHWTVYERSW